MDGYCRSPHVDVHVMFGRSHERARKVSPFFIVKRVAFHLCYIF